MRVFTFGRGMDVWWKTHGAALKANSKVVIKYFDGAELQELTKLAEKTMNLTISITEGIAYISSVDSNVSVTLREMPEI